MLKPYVAIACVLSVALLAGCSTLPRAAQEQAVTAASSIKGVPISVSYQGGVLYRVQVNNTLPTAISLVWDESTYVTTTGNAVRLLHLPDRNDLPRQAPAQQAPSHLSAQSQFQADFTGDDWLDCARRNCTPQARDSLRHARIYLAFRIKGKVVRWQGEVAFAPPQKP